MWRQVAIVVLVAGVALAAEYADSANPPPAPVVATTDREQWAIDFLAALGNTQPSAGTVALVVAWQAEENTTARYNPLATSQAMPGATVFNSSKVKNYASYEDGIAATVTTLSYAYPGYADVLEGLRTNDPERALNGLSASPWAEEAGYGARVRALWRVPQAAPPPGIRAELVNYALSLQGIPYVRGGRSAAGGDCSGTMQHIFLTVAGIDIGATTFSQYPQLQPIDAADLLPGDLWFGQFPSDQHTGMVADVDGDGLWDLIHNGADAGSMHVTSNFMATYLGAGTMGFRRAV